MALKLGIILILCVGIRSQGADDIEEVTEAIGTVKVCSVCSCGEIRSDDEAAEIILNVQCSELDKVKEIPDLNRLEWPENPNRLKVSVTFEGIGLQTVESLPPNNLIEKLSFTNNLIKSTWPSAFSDLPALRRISFSQNLLSKITQDMFSKLPALEELDLSYNQLTSFNNLDFAELKNLRKVNLQSNNIELFPTEVFEKNRKLEDLDLSKNMIVDLDFKNGSNVLKTVKRMNLSGNNITNISAVSLPENYIELLDLSNNDISSVDDAAFAQCLHLRELNLASNQIASAFTVPLSVLSVTLAHNRLHDWPKFPAIIRHIDLSNNELYALYDQNYGDFDQLEILKLSANQLSKLELTTRLPKLLTLDLSYNLLEEIPSSVSSEMLPALSELRLDGNPIKRVYFQEKLSIRSIYLNDLESLTIVDNNALSNVESRPEPEVGCIQLYISNCPNLVEISETAFNGSSICLLDLSYNNLTEIPEGLLPWDFLKEGLNLQGNPWDCSCRMQWMLDDLLTRIHRSYPQYLAELRCETPRARQGLRMVHWLNWGHRVLCTNEYRPEPNQSYTMEGDSSPGPPVSTVTLVLGGCIVLALVIIAALSAYLIRTNNRRYRVKRAAAARRRQGPQDQNGQTEQFKALNRA